MKRHILTVVIALLAGFLGAFCYGQVDDVLHFPGSDYFADVAIDSPHNDDIGYAKEAGITMGLTPELYGSEFNVTREQMASFQMRDLAAAIALTVELATIQINLGGWDPAQAPTQQERGDMLRWAAELLDHENQVRPAEAIGGQAVYPYLAGSFREHALAIDPDGG